MYRSVNSAKKCPVCEVEFLASNNAQVYCCRQCRDRKANQQRTTSATHWTQVPRTCPGCGKGFYIPAHSSPNRRHCSDKCSLAAISLSTKAFKEANPTSMQEYNKLRYEKYGRDGLSSRIRKKYPDLPTKCEAKGCEEGRVLDFAHKPEYKRNGAHRLMKHYERHMFWVLCPNHHAIHDRGIESAYELGLVS